MSPTPRDIRAVAADLGLGEDDIEVHGRHRAKLSADVLEAPAGGRGRYVLVTAMTPTARGIGKTLTSIGLAMGLARLGRTSAVDLRQSSLGPTFGGKGGGAGGGASSIVPLDESLLGLGADLFAVETANNLLAAVIDDHLHRAGDIDPRSVTWKRVLDVDDRSLRHVVTGMGGRNDGVPREAAFEITAASELMGVLALSSDLDDLRERLRRVVPAWDRDGQPLTAGQLGAAGAMAALMRDAARPNLMQTSEGTPALIHAGPFANIAPGCSSVIADRFALGRVDFVVTEAGFGADLGAEKFIHLKCPASGHQPDVAVLVVSLQALREHGGASPTSGPDAAAVAVGVANLVRHVGILRGFGLPVVVAVNRFPDDTAEELALVAEAARGAGAHGVAEHTAFVDGGAGCTELAGMVQEACTAQAAVHGLYGPDDPIREKVRRLATTVYGADGVEWQPAANRAVDRLERAGFGHLAVCVAKTHLSLSHDPTRRGAPSGFVVPVRDVQLAAGAGYVTVLAGDISTMPGLPSNARLYDIDLAADGRITGLG